MPDDLGVMIIFTVVQPCRTVAEQFFLGFQLLVDFQAGFKPDAVVIGLSDLFAGHIPDRLFARLVVLARVKMAMRIGFLGHLFSSGYDRNSDRLWDREHLSPYLLRKHRILFLSMTEVIF